MEEQEALLGDFLPPLEPAKLPRPVLANEIEFHEGLVSLQNFSIRSFYSI